MKVIIAGTRELENPQAVVDAVRASGFKVTEVVSGCCRGADTLGEEWAQAHRIPVKRFPADWNGPLKRGAGHARNAQMASYADALIAIRDGITPGTQNMIERAQKRGMPIYVHDLCEVEIEERYCEIAARRLAQEVLAL